MIGRGHFKSHMSDCESLISKPSPRAKKIYSVPRSIKQTLQPTTTDASPRAVSKSPRAMKPPVGVRKVQISQPPPVNRNIERSFKP
jgi:hypothetical protein